MIAFPKEYDKIKVRLSRISLTLYLYVKPFKNFLKGEN